MQRCRGREEDDTPPPLSLTHEAFTQRGERKAEGREKGLLRGIN